MSKGRQWLALSPLVVFLAVYLVTAIVAGDFYKVPISAAFLLASIYGVCVAQGPVKERIGHFLRGAGSENVLLMIVIFILAGAFAGTAKDIGAIDATVDATLNLMPPAMLYAGLFLTACFISMAVGTSVGTIVALMPLGAGIAAEAGVSVAHLAAIVVGGAFFGDNLSFISDTTIASTRAAGCAMRDKFRTNIRIIAPAVIIVTAIYIVQGQSISVATEHHAVDWVKMLPYLLVIVLALLGQNVSVILAIGIAANALIGFLYGDFTWDGWLESLGGGIAGMNDLIVVTLLAGGMLELIRAGGGLDLIVHGLTHRIRGPRGAQLAIAALVSLANVCTANNTIAIITVGGIAKDIGDRYGVAPRKLASLLDTFSCLVQGLIPYGAQILMAAGIAGIAPTAIIPHLYYPFIMGFCALIAILLNYPRH